jgi:hypothetical protein
VQQACQSDNPDYNPAMKKLGRWWQLALVCGLFGVIAATGCRTDSGSKEFIPGKGWRNAQRQTARPAAAPIVTAPL